LSFSVCRNAHVESNKLAFLLYYVSQVCVLCCFKLFCSVTAGESDHVSKTLKSASSSSSSSDSGSSSDDESEPLYHLRERRQTFFSYRFNEFDDLINSAIQVKTNSFTFHAFNNCVGVIHKLMVNAVGCPALQLTLISCHQQGLHS